MVWPERSLVGDVGSSEKLSAASNPMHAGPLICREAETMALSGVRFAAVRITGCHPGE